MVLLCSFRTPLAKWPRPFYGLDRTKWPRPTVPLPIPRRKRHALLQQSIAVYTFPGTARTSTEPRPDWPPLSGDVTAPRKVHRDRSKKIPGEREAQALMIGAISGLGSNVTAGMSLTRWVSRRVSRRSASAVRAWMCGLALALRR